MTCTTVIHTKLKKFSNHIKYKVNDRHDARGPVEEAAFGALVQSKGNGDMS
jgi:hypothetical protein